jgi:hypothetical protein
MEIEDCSLLPPLYFGERFEQYAAVSSSYASGGRMADIPIPIRFRHYQVEGVAASIRGV